MEFEATRALRPSENLSMLMKFEPGAFEPYDEGFAGVIRTLAAILSLGLATVALAMAVRFRVRNSDKKGRGIIVPEHLQPEGISVLMAAGILAKQKFLAKSVAAQIIDLAVKGRVKIIESEKKKFFSKSKEYEIELVSPDGLADEELKLLGIFFDGKYSPGNRYKFDSKNTVIGMQIQELHKSLKKKVLDQEYRRKAKNIASPIVFIGLALLSSIVLSVHLSNRGVEDWRTGVVFLVFLASFPVFGMVVTAIRPLTDEGRSMVDYLKGLEMYIKLAETERLRVLQSPKGALKTPIDTNDKEQVVKLYEKLLPYAVLFGQEKEWLEQLSVYYEQQHTTPGWYAGTAGFNASSFASSISSFSASTSSSSSGFSGGGGSGGGGGGGGGGGR